MKIDTQIITEQKIIDKFFKKSEIQKIEPLDYHFTKKKKIIVYTPKEFVDKLTSEMSKAGAGVIGNYTMCSFRIEGTGTYKPNSKATPYKGKSGELSFEKEIKLEMECNEEVLNKVVDALLENHPYDEIVYEIYGFSFRENKTDGAIVELKKKLRYSDLLSRINKKVSSKEYPPIKRAFKRIALIQNKTDEISLGKCKFNKVEALISTNKNVNITII